MGEDDVLVVYKHRSRGEVLGIHNSVSELANLENNYRAGRGFVGSIYQVINGKTKHFISFHYRCKVVVRIRKLKEFQSQLQS